MFLIFWDQRNTMRDALQSEYNIPQKLTHNAVTAASLR